MVTRVLFFSGIQVSESDWGARYFGVTANLLEKMGEDLNQDLDDHFPRSQIQLLTRTCSRSLSSPWIVTPTVGLFILIITHTSSAFPLHTWPTTIS